MALHDLGLFGSRGNPQSGGLVLGFFNKGGDGVAVALDLSLNVVDRMGRIFKAVFLYDHDLTDTVALGRAYSF